MKDFINYMLSFYGEHGLYPISATTNEILVATGMRLERHKNIEFSGDSFDREMVRDIIIELREQQG